MCNPDLLYAIWRYMIRWIIWYDGSENIAPFPFWSDSLHTFRNVTSRSSEWCPSVLLTADQWAEGLPGVRHEGLDLVDAARHAGQELHAACGHGDVVLDAHLDHNITNNNNINNDIINQKQAVTKRSLDWPLDSNSIPARDHDIWSKAWTEIFYTWGGLVID